MNLHVVSIAPRTFFIAFDMPLLGVATLPTIHLQGQQAIRRLLVCRGSSSEQAQVVAILPRSYLPSHGLTPGEGRACFSSMN